MEKRADESKRRPDAIVTRFDPGGMPLQAVGTYFDRVGTLL
ncbi:MAG: hypothetical protein ACKVY0_12265 [Prosthecobacter sp.]